MSIIFNKNLKILPLTKYVMSIIFNKNLKILPLTKYVMSIIFNKNECRTKNSPSSTGQNLQHAVFS